MKDIEYTNEEKRKMIEFSKSFVITNASNVIEFGKIVQNRLSTLSDTVLNMTKEKDVDNITLIINDIMKELNKMNKKNEKRSFIDFFTKPNNDQTNEINYTSILNNIELLQIELQKHLFVLNKDLQFIELLKINNKEFLRELDMYLITGKLILKKSNNDKETLKDDRVKFNDYVQAIDRFEKRLYDLELTRTMTLQMDPQINLMRDNTYALIDRINSIIKVTIPLCKNQIIILISQQEHKDMVQEQNEISKLLNEALKDNSSGLSEMTKDLRNQLNKGTISDLTLQATTNTLLTMVNDIIQKDKKEEVENPMVLEL